MSSTLLQIAVTAILVFSSLAVLVNGDGDCTPSTYCDECFATYVIDSSHEANLFGCFHSKGKESNALPFGSLVNRRGTIDWAKWQCDGDGRQIIADQCGKLAVEKNMDFFGVEFYGECYFGSRSDIDTSQGRVLVTDGCESTCKYNVGGPDVMTIYEVVYTPSEESRE